MAVGLSLLAGCFRPPLAQAPAGPPTAQPGAVTAVPAAPASSGLLALAPAGDALAAANPDSGTVTLLRLPEAARLAEVPVGADPRGVAFTPDGAWLLAASHGAGALAFVDLAQQQVAATLPLPGQPYGVVAHPAGGRAYVSLLGRSAVAVVDTTTRQVLAEVAVDPFPAGLAISAQGDTLWVTHLYSGRVSQLDTLSLAVRQVAAAEPEANLAQFIALSPDGTRAYLPQTYSLAANPQLGYDSTARPVVGVLDTASARYLPEARLDLAALAWPANLPFAAAVSPAGDRLYVANAGSDDVAVIDLAAGQASARLKAGRNPRGLALAPGGARLYVLNALDGSLSIYNTRTLQLEQTVAVTRLPLPQPVLTGKRLFNSALPPMSQDGWISCASCHLDGGADGRTWLGFPDGPRNTPALFGAALTLPLHWNGDLDELHDVEATIRAIQFGRGLVEGEPFPGLGAPNAGRSAALDALAAYLATLRPPASPYAPAPGDTAAAEAVARGQRAFERWGCAACHVPPLYADGQAHASAIGDPAQERRQAGPLPRFDTPSLLGAWATAPYFHDGSAPTLRDTLFGPGFHRLGYAMDEREVADLVAFMQALPLAAAP